MVIMNLVIMIVILVQVMKKGVNSIHLIQISMLNGKKRKMMMVEKKRKMTIEMKIIKKEKMMINKMIVMIGEKKRTHERDVTKIINQMMVEVDLQMI